MTTLTAQQRAAREAAEADRNQRRGEWEKSRWLTRTPGSQRTGARSVAGVGKPDFSAKEAESTTGRFGHTLNAGEIVGGGGATPGEFGNADQYRDDLSSSGKDGTNKSLSDTHSDNITYSGAAFASFGLAVSAASAVKVFMDGGTSLERFNAILNAGTSATAMAGAISSAVKASEGGDNASAMTKMADGVLNEIASVAGAMKEGWDLVVKIAEAIKAKGDVDSTMDFSEKATSTVEIVKSLLLTAKGSVDAINNFMRHLGSVSTGLVQAAPAIGIAINACDMIVNGISIAESYISMVEMRQQKRDDKEKVLGRKANKSAGLRGFFGGHESAEDEAKRRIDANKAKVTRNAAGANEAFSDLELEDLRNAEDYMLNKNLQAIAQKRINRGVLNITKNAVAIAGDIAILSGAGAAVGAGLKASSAGIGLAAAALRIGKQWYHNAKEDDPKSEKNKLATYDTMILHMVRNLEEANAALPANPTPADSAKKVAKQELALRQVYASGMTPAKLQGYSPKARKSLEAQAQAEYERQLANPVPGGPAPQLGVVTATDVDKAAGKALYTDWIAALKKRE